MREMNTKVPCEVITWYLLPAIRRKLALILLGTHHTSQAEAARMLDLSDAAISQYVSKKRGGIEIPPGRDQDFQDATRRIVEGYSVDKEICRLCQLLRDDGIIDTFHIEGDE